jgi:type II secretory pathway pseudopilin PulG
VLVSQLGIKTTFYYCKKGLLDLLAYAILKSMGKGVRNTKRSPYWRRNGYTIVETMIFLAVSGVILSTSLLFFRGRQERIQYTQGVREVESQIKTIMNEVSSGYFPNDGSFSCAGGGAAGPILNFAATGGQGTNEDCVFLGKVIRFNEGSNYSSYSVLGLRKTGDELSSTLAGAKPIIDEKVSETYALPWGIKVTKVANVDGTPPNISSVGLILSLGASSGAPGPAGISSGSRSADLLPIINTNGLSDDFSRVSSGVNGMLDSQRRPKKIIICLISGGGDRKSAIVLGGEGKQLSAETFIDSTFPECN